MFDFEEIVDRGRLLFAILVIAPLIALGGALLGASDTAVATDEWVAQYTPAPGTPGGQEVSASQILDSFAASGGTPLASSGAGALGPASDSPEGEVTTPLPANYVSGAAPNAALAAALRKAQQRNSSARAPAAGSAAYALTLNPRIRFTRQSQIDDLRSGQVDARLVDVLTWIANRRSSIVITSMKTDHSTCVAGSSPCRVSAHKLGRAVDIASVDGEACYGTPSSKCGILFEEIINALRGTQFQPSQIIYGYDPFPSESWNFAMGNHRDHIHLGY